MGDATVDRWKLEGRLHLWHYPNRVKVLEGWHLERREGNVLALTVGAEKLREVEESLLGLPEWKDDFVLGPEAHGNRHDNGEERARFDAECLWFWTKVE